MPLSQSRRGRGIRRLSRSKVGRSPAAPGGPSGLRGKDQTSEVLRLATASGSIGHGPLPSTHSERHTQDHPLTSLPTAFDVIRGHLAGDATKDWVRDLGPCCISGFFNRHRYCRHLWSTLALLGHQNVGNHPRRVHCPARTVLPKSACSVSAAPFWLEGVQKTRSHCCCQL